MHKTTHLFFAAMVLFSFVKPTEMFPYGLHALLSGIGWAVAWGLAKLFEDEYQRNSRNAAQGGKERE